jgi:putative transposase
MGRRLPMAQGFDRLLRAIRLESGRCMDNVFIGLWRSLKYEEVYLHAYGNVAAAKAGIGAWLVFYNEEHQHQSQGYRTPRQVYEAQCRWICGRSVLPTGASL